MLSVGLLRFVLLTVLVSMLSEKLLYSQGTQRVPDVTDRKSVANSDPGKDDNLEPNQRVRGQVILSDGTLPGQVVEINASCPTSQRLMAVADSRGKFSFSFEPNRQSDRELTIPGCYLYASLVGYRSKALRLADINTKLGQKLGKVVLEQISTSATGLTSNFDSKASEKQKRAYQKALDKASRQDYKGAIRTLEEIVSSYPAYPSAWLTLGICEQINSDFANAEKSYLEAAGIDPQFAVPLIHAAALETSTGNMQASLTHSQQVIKLYPKSFPDAYALNAMANISFGNTAAAKNSAQAGLAVDTARQYPELEYALGMILRGEDDRKAASEHLQKYIDLLPNGPNVVAARNQLAQMQRVDLVVSKLALGSAQRDPNVTPRISEPVLTTGSLQTHNAPLLANSSSYTCLESILPGRIELDGRPFVSQTSRADIAISNGNEIYGPADGKRFSSNTQRELLDSSFTTTGLFSSIARALIAGGQFAIEPAGALTSGRQSFLRYSFHSLPSTAGWKIVYGNESATAAEQGWFLVDSKSHTLRRVYVMASDIPGNLRLVGLSALVDYEVETIAGHRVLLPSVAKVEVGEKSGRRLISLMSFDHCRAFTAESAISFEVTDVGTQSGKTIPPTRLPTDLEVIVSLNSPISVTEAENTDLITATIAKPVFHNGHKLIETGAPVEGHFWLKWGRDAIVIQLDRVHTQRGWAPFYAKLVKLDAASQAQIQPQNPEQVRLALLQSDPNAEFPEPEVPGVATVIFQRSKGELPAGTKMVWKLELLQINSKDTPIPQLSTPKGLR